MNLVKCIEIRYFRSLYNVKLQKLSDLNIIFGRNDSGKSNALRALNLFFNYETNPGLQFDFSRDFSRVRLDEAAKKNGAKKFVYVKVTFNTPDDYKPSLGTEFYVKRQWTIEGNPTRPTETISPHIKKVQYLRRFMGTIDFQYIPAIKDRQIFESLLGKLYSVLADEKNFAASLSNFTKEVKNRTKSLKDSLKENVGVVSSIAPPDNLQNLFKSLDFHTGPTGEQFSLTLQRGDGVQVRHIPEILKFIADQSQSKVRHIWGFEEPENSLEYAAAIKEAKLFEDYARTPNKQVFMTSHSPAFFGLSGKNKQKFYVSHSENEFGRSEIEPFSEDADEASIRMGEMPYLLAASEAIARKKAEIEELEQEQKQLAASVKKGEQPLLFVEGETDKIILEAAWKIFLPKEELPVLIKVAGGTKGLKGLSASQSFLRETFGKRRVLVLVDNDRDGRATVEQGGALSRAGKWHKVDSGADWCFLKPTTEFIDWTRSNKLPNDIWPFIIEYCFSPELRRKAMSEGAYEHNEKIHQIFFDESKRIPQSSLFFEQNYTGHIRDDFLFFARPPHHEFKKKFAAWVTCKERCTPELFSAFEGIIVGLKAALEDVRDYGAN